MNNDRDQSHLDSQYFIDQYVYNCPFCRRRNVSYYVGQEIEFEFSVKKPCYAYVVVCTSCKNRSLHFSFKELLVIPGQYAVDRRFALPNSGGGAGMPSPGEAEKVSPYWTDLRNLDKAFFHSIPSSYFVLSSDINGSLRELFAEAKGCLGSNHLTGASACIRKVVFELARLEGAEGDDYASRIKGLKEKRPDVDPAYFDQLYQIHQVTSEKVHERSYDGWNATQVRAILDTLQFILHEMYVLPKERQRRGAELLKIKEMIMNRSEDASGGTTNQDNG